MIKQTNSLPDKLAQDILRRIVTAEFPPSSVLPSERDLQEQYGVSRTGVRESIKVLLARGIITSGAGQGAIVGADVTRPARDALLLTFRCAQVYREDLLHTRMLLEPQIAALAAQHATQRSYDGCSALLRGSTRSGSTATRRRFVGMKTPGDRSMCNSMYSWLRLPRTPF